MCVCEREDKRDIVLGKAFRFKGRTQNGLEWNDNNPAKT